MVVRLPEHENQAATTHVESSLVPRLDGGSSPPNSTIVLENQAIVQIMHKYTHKGIKAKHSKKCFAFIFLRPQIGQLAIK